MRPGWLLAATLTVPSITGSSSSKLDSPPYAGRFKPVEVLAGLPPLILDAVGNSVGVAQEYARKRRLQARYLWIDATANVEKYNSAEDVRSLVTTIKESGFNGVVFDVKPIVGFTVYPSAYAPRLTEWRGAQIPADFDPLDAMVKECRANGIRIFVSLNAFSEGHRLTGQGLGYDWPLWQSVLYEPIPYVVTGASKFPIYRTQNFAVADGSAISSFSSPDNVKGFPSPPTTISVARDGRVVGVGTTVVPRNGALLAGVGDAGKFLSESFSLGDFVRIETEAAFRTSADLQDQIPLMMNPNEPAVRRRNLDILREVVGRYPVDGVIYDDRLRYAGLNADFGPRTRAMFERRIGRKITWPDDVFRFTFTPALQQGVRIGPYYEEWLTFRAETLRDWVREAARAVRAARPGALFGVYAGSGYLEYPKFGANWAADQFSAGFWFLTPAYAKTGFASELDLFIPGCYYPTPTMADGLEEGIPIGNTIEAAGQLANRAVRDQAWTYAGIALDQYTGNPDGLLRALQAACGSSQGVMVFDLSHGIEPMWPVFRRAFANPAASPDAQSDLLAAVRKERARRDKAGVKEPPVIIPGGLPGVGL
ncbi:MAG: hypothetical protein D8M53_00485 [Armatimonadetes bacterium]|nr:hypothetical protein [Armatimonadota bacterium]